MNKPKRKLFIVEKFIWASSKAYENGIDNAVAALGIMNADFLQVRSLWMEERHVQSNEPM